MMEAMSIALLIPIVLMILLVDDRRTKIYLSFFAWGSVSGLIGRYLNGIGRESLGMSFQKLAVEFAPLAEEFSKAIPLFVLVFLLPSFLEKKEAILASIFSGIGFSVVENYFYMLQEQGMEAGELAVFVMTRSISTTIMHGMATGIIGGMVYYIYTGGFRKFGFKYIYVFMAYAFAVAFHALFNLYVQFGVFGKAIGVISSVVIYFFAWAFFELYYERL